MNELTVVTIGFMVGMEIGKNWNDYQDGKVTPTEASVNVATVIAKEGARIAAFSCAKTTAATGTELILNNIPTVVTETATMIA